VLKKQPRVLASHHSHLTKLKSTPPLPPTHTTNPSTHTHLQVSCANGGPDAEGLAFLRELLPNNKLLRSRAAIAQMERPNPDCILDAAPVLTYFEFGRGFYPSFGILLCYWLITHVLTYVALRVVAKKEKR